MSLKPCVGDHGQRYEIWCDDEDGEPMQVGWSNSPGAFREAVRLHPVWTNHRAVDRLAHSKVESRRGTK